MESLRFYSGGQESVPANIIVGLDVPKSEGGVGGAKMNQNVLKVWSAQYKSNF